MKRKAFIFILMAIVAILALGSCLSNPAGKNDAKDNLDWEGVYEGTIPAADCDGINVSMELFKDQSYQMSYEYIGKSTEPILWKGKFKWDDTGNIIILDVKEDTPSYYKVEKTKLIQLDMKGKLIKGKLAENYYIWKVL